MTYKQLFAIVKASGMSAERFADPMGVSGMTLRRWKSLPPGDTLPEMYRDAVVRVVRKLVSEGTLSAETDGIQSVLNEEWLPFEMAAKGLGISADMLSQFKASPNGPVDTLSEIGASDVHREKVDASASQIQEFKKKGEDWAFRITKLWEVVRSKKLTRVEKVVAYGALFYLINPFDFIPDHIPVFGFLDDLFFLSAALSFYLKRYPELFSSKR